MPPLLLNNLTLVNLINSPESLPIPLVQKNALVNLPLGWVFSSDILSKLMLVILTIERHLYFSRTFCVCFGIVHGFVAIVAVFSVTFGKCNLVFLCFGGWFGAEFSIEMGFVMFVEILFI